MDVVNLKDGVSVKRQISQIVSKTKEYQEKVQDIITSHFDAFLPTCYDNLTIMRNGKLLEEEINSVLAVVNVDTAKQLQVAQCDMKQFREELTNVIAAYKASFKLQTIYSLFEMIPRIAEDYDKLLQLLEKLKVLLHDETDTILPKLDCYEGIRLRYQEEYQTLRFNLKQQLQSLIQLQEKSFQSTKTVKVLIKNDEKQLHRVVTALVKTDYNIRHICKFLLDNIFEPTITRPVSLTRNESEGDYATIELSYQVNQTEELRPSYKITFARLMEIFYALSQMNIVINDKHCMFSMIARQIKGELCRLIIDRCLQDDIPDTIDEMNESNIVQATKEFNSFLNEMLFVDEEHDSILDDYASKIESIFQNKFCSKIVATGVDIMKKDLHEMVLIEDREAQFSSATEMLSRCMVSKSTIEMKKLLDKILSECLVSESNIAEKLMKTIATLLDRYATEVIQTHEKLLHKIPQQSALFFNNCIYLSFWIQKNSGKLRNNSEFMLIGNNLRVQGQMIFDNQLQDQRGQLLQSLEGFNISNDAVELSPEPQKAVRQCLRQFELLKSVWQTVLPGNTYRSSLGGLLSTFIAEVITRILVLEDITASIGSGLVHIIHIIKEKTPLLFQDPNDTPVAVRNWMKFMHLQKILEASLVEITELWAEGKGPLALFYKPEEIKHLIRALFQNTKQRQLCLASIV